MDFLNELIAASGGSVITMVATKLLHKRNEKVDIETKVNTMISEYSETLYEQLQEIKRNASELGEKNIELRMENHRVNMQNNAYKHHLDKCNECDKSSIFIVGN